MTTTACPCEHRHPLHCIIPEYILDQLLHHPDPTVRDSARMTKAVSSTFRNQRAQAAGVRVVASPPAAVGAPVIAVHDARHGTALPGTRVVPPAPTGTDREVKEAHDGLLSTHKFYADLFARDSLDGRGMPLTATVHFGDPDSGGARYNNAFWNGGQMVFGDGDGVVFHPFTRSLDVIGHELAHGVTDHAGGINYQFQSGAVNEHMSDVFGSLVRQYALNQTAAEADWLLGAGLMVSAPCLRSLADPHAGFGTQPGTGKPGQPKHMSEFNALPFGVDRGGVHINSGIPNHAFYHAATLLGGHAWTTAGRVWYEVLTATSGTISANCTLRELANVTAKFAIALSHPDGGRDGRAHTAVTLGWQRVGIAVADPSTKSTVPGSPPPVPPPTPTDGLQAKLDAAKAALRKIKADAEAVLVGL